MRLIDADELIEHLRKDPLFELVERYGIVDVINSRPTVDIKTIKAYSAGYEQGRLDKAVESGQRGRWERLNVDDENIISCSVCGFADSIEFGERPYKYCPNCGAKMDGGDGE